MKMTEKTGLRMNNEMTMKEKRFSFFADPQESKAERRPTLHTFTNHMSQPSNQNSQKSAICNMVLIHDLEKQL